MPSFVVTATVPMLVMLAVRRLRWQRVLAMAPIVLLPDLDYLLGVHRATFHNLWILAPLAAWLWYELDRGAGWARGEWAVIAGGYLASHLVMDAFVGGISPLWPVTSKAVFLWVAVEVDTRTNELDVIFDPGTLPGAPATSETFTWISPTDVAIVVVLAGAALVTWAVYRRPT
jgi:hypothetical protein